MTADLLPKLMRQFHLSHALYSHAHQLSPAHWELLSTVMSLKGLMLQMDPAAKQVVTQYISKVCVGGGGGGTVTVSKHILSIFAFSKDYSPFPSLSTQLIG